MTEQERQDQMIEETVALETAIISAHAVFATRALALGYREQAIDAMANAIMIAEHMDMEGRSPDTVAGLMQILPRLQADGIKDAVLARIKAYRAGKAH
ncbi:hypothetical protein KZ813_17850 [Sphingomonas sp. RHCKR7]|uniref:hypothetical protein n=1 Tax=Sphingomonas folli TaxID=2862497 RepID=UPI001CA5CD4C|nr:hypothetical protein [Sphingomonas folli]MBW6528709.1 hypothetical protein [Sphingomonas folli]